MISLARATERRDRITRRLRALGVSFEVVDAIDAMSVTEHELDSAINRIRFWCEMGRDALPGEIACKLSHEKAWQQAGDETVCILEDDAELDDLFSKELDNVAQLMDPEKSQVVLLSKNRYPLMFADGYVITAKAREVLRKTNTPMRCPCDFWFKWRKAGIIDAWHHETAVVSQDISQTTIGRTKSLCQMNIVETAFWALKRLIGKTLGALMP